MKISIIHPSRHRIKQALATREKWLLRADNPVEYIFSFDSDDDTIPSYVGGLRSPNKTAIEAINAAALNATGNLFIVVSDDFDCPEHWDTLLLKEIGGEEDFVVKTQDGIQKTLITLPILDRKYYNRFGYIYHPDFLHMGSDVEFTAVAHMLGRVINSDLMFEHLHYTTGKSPKDAISEKNDLTYRHGDEVLEEHKKNNFGIDNPVCTYESIVWH
jgi:hypothetical protein